ncbi:MAG: sodium:proton exchanger [Epsilonproteobacteria bacterium]|nr:sodium:proton exchanger [Campylobacterota bacterium]
MNITLIILAILFISLIFNIPLSRFKIPPIIGYIFTGILVTALFHIEKETIDHIAEFGIIFLMFLIGLEFSPDKLKRMKKEVFLFGTLEMSLVGVIFGILFHIIFHIDWNVSFIIGGALALSSTAIVLKLLNESREIAKPYGNKSLGILLFQDIAVIPILIAISIITNNHLSLSQMVIQTIIGFIGLIVAILIFGKYIAPFIISKAVTTKSDEIFLSTILLIVIAAAEAAHFFGLSYSLGAFLAGMIISETPFKYQIEADLVPFRDLLLAIFFVSVGLSVNLDFAISHIGIILVYTVGIMVVKALIIFMILRFFTTKRIAIKTALSLSQVGEFAFVIFALFGKYNLVDNDLLQILIVAVVISMIATPFILKYLYSILTIFDNNIQEEIPKFDTIDSQGHIIVVGYDKIGKRICSKLTYLEIPYVAVDKQIEHVQEGIKKGDNVIFGNAGDKNILEALNIQEASTIIITTLNETNTHLITENVLALNPNINIIVISEDEIEQKFYKENKVIFVDKNKEVAKQIMHLLSRISNTRSDFTLKANHGSN